jgi:vancomycin resistance protein YoaR
VKLFNGSDKSVLAPGEKLSLNDILGDRTEAAGWKLAPGYVRGKTEDQPGGGVCQVSTTLYCAALKADLEIVSRVNHSIPVGYADRGLDATISTGGPDLVIRNNTKENLYLRTWISAEQKLYFEIYGLPFEGFDSIGLDTEKLREIEPEGEMQVTVDETLTADEEEIIVERRRGSEWETYKCYQRNGKVIKRKSAGKSIYKAFSGEKIVGTS